LKNIKKQKQNLSQTYKVGLSNMTLNIISFFGSLVISIVLDLKMGLQYILASGSKITPNRLQILMIAGRV